MQTVGLAVDAVVDRTQSQTCVSRTGPCVTTAAHGVIPILTVGAVGSVGAAGSMRPPDAICRLYSDARVVSTNPRFTLPAAGRPEARVGHPVKAIGHIKTTVEVPS